MGKKGRKPLLSKAYIKVERIIAQCPKCLQFRGTFKGYYYTYKPRYHCQACGYSFYLSQDATEVPNPPLKIIRRFNSHDTCNIRISKKR
jgi:uncharacterized protein (DUF983 family)